MFDRRFQEDGRPHRERMLAGDQYIASDPDLIREAVSSDNTWALAWKYDGIFSSSDIAANGWMLVRMR